MPVFRPGKPFYIGRRSSNFNSVVGTTDITWNDVESDGEFGLTTSGVQQEIAVAGLYIVTLTARKAAGAPTSTLQLHLAVGGVIKASTSGNQAAGQQSSSTALVDQLEVGDVITSKVQTTAVVALEAASTRLSIVRIGPVRWT